MSSYFLLYRLCASPRATAPFPRCWHAQAVVEHLGGPEPHESVDASDDQVSALQAQLSKYLDDAGRMKATCVSKASYG